MDHQYPTVAKIPVIEFEDSYVVPTNTTATDTTSGEKSGRTVTLTVEDMQRKKNDVKARTTLLLSLPDEHQLQFTTKKTKKNLLKQQYGNFKQKAKKLWSRRLPDYKSDLNTMSLDDLYNHLKVYESEVQKKTEPHSQNMVFISSPKHSSKNKDGNTASVPTASTNVPTASASVATISQDTACAYIASQSSGSQIKFEDINQIDKEDMEDMDIKWNMTLLSMRADKFWKKTGKKISIQGSDVAGFEKSKAPKALMAIDGVGWDWSYMANKEEDHALVTDKVVPTEFALMANTSAESKKLETLKQEKEGVDGKLAGLLTASKDLDNLIESQRSDKNKEGLGYTVVPPPPAQLYLSSKKGLSWTGLPECADDTVTDYCRPSPTVETTSKDDQNRIPFVSKNVASPITPKPFIKFVKPKDSQSKSKTGKTESPKKPLVKYAEQYRKPNKKPNVIGNQRNWNNLKSHQLGPDFVMKKKACFNCGDFNHLAYDCRKRVRKNFTRRPVAHKPYRPSQRPMITNMNDARPNRTFFNKQALSYANRPVHRTSAVRSPYRAPWVPTVNRNYPPVNRKFSTSSRNYPTANRKFPTTSRKFPTGSTKSPTTDMGRKGKAIKPSAFWFWKPSYNLSNKGPKNNSGSSQNKIDDKGYWDNGCSRHIIGNISYLSDYEPFDGGYVSFGQGGCKITGKGTIKISKLEFENVYFVKDLKYNLFSVSQTCDNKNNVLFTDSEYIVLGRDFKLLDDANILLRTPSQHNMYSIDLNNIVPHRDITCLVAKASADECMLWHRRLGHLNFKTMNELVRHNLVRGLPTKCFKNDHTCTACLKGKQHKASCKSKLVNSVTKPLHTLHMDLFGTTSVGSISYKWYCLVVTDDFSRCDNGGEFRNKEMNDFCSQKGIKREFSNARTPQQNGVAERRNRTLIEVDRTMLAYAKLPVTFWAEAVNTACYVQNRVLVNKSHNKTPYELFNGRSPAIGFLKPFGCHVMILNTLDNLGKFEEKGDEGYFIGYSMFSKAFRVFNKRTRRVEENFHVEFLENKAIDKGFGPNWLFDINSLTKSMNYVPVDAGTISTNLSGTKDAARQEVKKDVSSLRYIALPNWAHDALLEFSSSKPQDHCSTKVFKGSGNPNPTASTSNPPADQMETLTMETHIPTISSPVPTAYSTDSQEPSSDARLILKRVANQEETPSLDNNLSLTNRFEDILGGTTNLDESNGEEADISNLEKTIRASPTPTLRMHKDHPKSQIIGPMDTSIQTRNKSKEVGEQSFIATIHQKTDPALL
nr:hypothetical protein [Tanacetum cinerariifolium]